MRYNSRYFRDTITVKRDTYVWNKSSYVDLGVTYKGYLKIRRDVQVDQEGNQKLAMTYHLTTEYWANILSWDVVTVNWVEYNVRDIWDKSWLLVQYKFCILDRKD